MLNLIIREFILSSRLLIYTYLAYGLLAFIAFRTGLMDQGLLASLILMAVMFAFVPVTIIAREDKFKAGAWTCSLPVTRRQIVTARYLLSGLLGLFGLVLLVILKIFAGPNWGSVENLVSFREFSIALGATVIVLSLVLPLLLRYGVISLLMLATGLNVLGLIGFILFAATSLRNPLQSVIGQIASLTSELYQLTGDSGLYVVAVLFVLLLAGGSFLLAQRLYANLDF